MAEQRAPRLVRRTRRWLLLEPSRPLSKLSTEFSTGLDAAFSQREDARRELLAENRQRQAAIYEREKSGRDRVFRARTDDGSHALFVLVTRGLTTTLDRANRRERRLETARDDSKKETARLSERSVEFRENGQRQMRMPG